MNNAIRDSNIFWDSLTNDCKYFVNNCSIFIKLRTKKALKPKILAIKTKGSNFRYVIDGWKLHNIITTRCGYTWMVDIIDHFSKFLWSYPLEKNDAKSILTVLKQFIFSFSKPEILQSDNGREYKNDIISTFCTENNIKQFFSSPYRPSTNGVVEVSYK